MKTNETPLTLRQFLYRLWFTRDDDLDALQVLFALIIIVTLAIVWHATILAGNADLVKIESLVTLRWLAGLLVITAVPKWLVPFVASQVKPNNTVPNQPPTDSQPEELS